MEHAVWARSARLFAKDDVQEKFEEWFGKEGVVTLGAALRCAPCVTTLRLLSTGDRDGAPDVASVLKDLRQSPVGADRDIKVHDVIGSCIVITPKEAATPKLKRHPQSVVVDYMCGEAVLRGADIFAPGILASTSRYEIGLPVNILVAISPKDTPLKGSLVDRDLCDAGSTLLMHIAGGVAAMKREDVVKQGSGGVAVRVTERLVDHPPMDGVLQEVCMLQNIPSMVPPLVLDPKAGMRVIDMCAAPGGKTAHLADLMQCTGELVALDRSAKRLEELKRVVATATNGATFVTCAKLDATKAPKTYGKAQFDRVLLDPPCSGLGLRPKLQHNVTMSQLTEFASYQRRLMTSAYELCKVGGRIVYSTCTISPLENEGNVAWFLEQHPGRVVLEVPTEATQSLFDLGSHGLTNCGLTDDACKHVVRFTPTVDSPYTGFFVASFIRKE